MKKESALSSIIYIFGPVIRYIVVSEVVAAAMDFIWTAHLQQSLLQGAGAAASHTVTNLWSFLALFVSAGAGCLSVRREAQLERDAFFRAQLQRRSLYCSGTKPERPGIWQVLYRAGTEKVRRRVLALLLTASVFMSLGINVLFSYFMQDTGLHTPAAALPGFAGFLVQLLLYCFFMPFVEETVFRGIFYPRLQRWYGSGAAVPASAFFFGIYHGNAPQAVYACLMGIVFAASYEAFGRLTVPIVLHGTCNLIILYLGWTGRYSAVCTPAWASVFAGAAAAGFLTMYMIIKKTAE